MVAYDQLQLTLQNQPSSPIRVRGGIFVDASLPQPTAGWATAPTVTGDTNYIVTGGSSAITVDLGPGTSASDIVGLIVGLEGHAGYFQVPLDGASPAQSLLISLRAYASYEWVPPVLVTRVALRDLRGRVSPHGTHMFQVASS